MTTGPQYLASLTALRRIVLARANDFHAECMLSYVTRVLIGDFVVVNLMVFWRNTGRDGLFSLCCLPPKRFIAPHISCQRPLKNETYLSPIVEEGFNFFKGRTLHLWQLQLSRVTTMVQFYTFGAYYQWRTRGRGPGSAFFGDPPPPHPYPPYLKVWIWQW